MDIMRIGLVMSCSKVPVTVGMVVISRLDGCGQSWSLRPFPNREIKNQKSCSLFVGVGKLGIGVKKAESSFSMFCFVHTFCFFIPLTSIFHCLRLIL